MLLDEGVLDGEVLWGIEVLKLRYCKVSERVLARMKGVLEVGFEGCCCCLGLLLVFLVLMLL